MPVYRCTVPVGLLRPDQKPLIANEIADIHCGLTSGTPRKFVHVIFEEVAEGNAFAGGGPSDVSKIVGLIRSGRTQETRCDLIRALTSSWRQITGQSEADIFVALTEVRPKDVMEWGEFLPEDGEEAAWVEKHGMERYGVYAT